MLSKDIKLELTDIIDGFIYAISQKHMLNRELTDGVINNARTSIVSMCQNYADIAGYEAYRCEVQLEKGKRVGLSLDWFEVFGLMVGVWRTEALLEVEVVKLGLAKTKVEE